MDDIISSQTIVIAMDGPAASGKSTVARVLARQLGFYFLNSGDLYRAMTWACLHQGLDCRCRDDVAAFAMSARVELCCDAEDFFPRINQDDPRPYLRDKNVNANVSFVAATPEVRHLISTAIRMETRGRTTVIEGRDIGSAVFPETPHKFYIDARPEVRQQRRRKEGQVEEIAHRDRLDSTRTTAPLMIAAGAMVIDSSDITIEEVVAIIREKLREQGLS